MDLDGAVEQELLQPRGGVRIVLFGRHEEREWPAAAAGVDGAAAHLVEILDDGLPVRGDGAQQAERRAQVVVDDRVVGCRVKRRAIEIARSREQNGNNRAVLESSIKQMKTV